MKNKEQKIAFLRAKIFFIIGFVIFGTVSLYARFTYPVYVPGRRTFSQELFFSVIKMIENEPLGGILFLISILILIFGWIQLKKSGWKSRN